MQRYDALFEACLNDLSKKHPCKRTTRCAEASGCARCLSAVMRGDVGVERIDVFPSGVVRLTIDSGHAQPPCVVSFLGVE